MTNTQVKILENKFESELSKLNLGTETDIYITHDNAANIVKATESSHSSEVIKLSFRCFCHTLQLCICDGFSNTNGMQKSLSKSKRVAAHVHQSHSAEKRLKEECDNLSIDYLKLIQVVERHWNGEYFNIKSVLHVKDALLLLSQYHDFNDNTPNKTEWELLPTTFNCQGTKFILILFIIR